MILDDGWYVTAREVSSHSPNKCHTVNVSNDINEAHLFRYHTIETAKNELNLKHSSDFNGLIPVAMLHANAEVKRTVKLKV